MNIEKPKIKQKSLPMVCILRNKIYEKYDQQFNKFRKFSINCFIANYTRASITLDYQDAMYQSDQKQYMLREISSNLLKNTTEIQLQILIKNLVSFDESFPKLSYEYPTMFLTKTHIIFLTRFRRQVLGKAVDDTLKEESKQIISNNSQSFSNKYLTKSFNDQCNYIRKYQKQAIQQQKNSSITNIYQNCKKLEQNINKHIPLKMISECQLKQLILNFDIKSMNQKIQGTQKVTKPLHSARKNFMTNSQKQRLKKIHQRETKRKKEIEKKISEQMNCSNQAVKNFRCPQKGRVHKQTKKLLETINNSEDLIFYTYK